jgi:transcription termination factor Rho
MAEEQTDDMNAPVADPAPAAPLPPVSGGTQPTVADGETSIPSAPAVPAGAPIPERVRLNDYLGMTLASLYALGESLGVRVGGTRAKHFLVFEIVSFYGRRGAIIEAEGILEIMREGFGLIRDPRFNFASFPDDVFISPSNLRRYNLQAGLFVKVICRAPRDVKDKFIAVESVESIEGTPVADYVMPVAFDKLTPLFPTERIILENRRTRAVATRVVDIIAPLGKGQRGLICAPPRGGKTILLKEIASSIRENHKEIELIVLLLDERPEEVTDFVESVGGHVFASTFDESAVRHIQVAELVMERAKRLVEMKRDVVILLDSLTRLSRGYNNMLSGKGGLMSGGMNPVALQRARKFFGYARKVEEGGSLTLLATALIETDSKMDEVIFEEFKGTGNMEIHIDREMAERRIYPAIHVQKTGTRKDELLYHPDEFRRISAIRRQLTQLPAGEAMEVLIKHLKATPGNAELLLTGLR